ENVGDMLLDGALTDEQFVRDLPIGSSLRDQRGDLALADGQVILPCPALARCRYVKRQILRVLNRLLKREHAPCRLLRLERHLGQAVTGERKIMVVFHACGGPAGGDLLSTNRNNGGE